MLGRFRFALTASSSCVLPERRTASSSSACSTIDDTLLLFISFLPLSSRCVLASLWCSLYFNLTAACSVPLRACTTLWARLSCTRLCSTNFVTFSDLEYVTFLAE